MKLKIKGDTEPVPEKTKTFFIIQDSYKGDLTVYDEDGWSVVGLRVVGGKVNLTKYRSIGGSDYNTNPSGQIQEVEE